MCTMQEWELRSIYILHLHQASGRHADKELGRFPLFDLAAAELLLDTFT